jgi:ankyrin repeat protein
MKMGGFFEATGWKDYAERYSLRIFDYLVVAPPDLNTPFHHAIRNFKMKGSVGQDALLRVIRCCQLCRFRSKNKEGQTPLWLAVSANEEEVVIAMIKRLRDPQRQFPIDPIILDSIDYRGLTILTTAISAWCSLPVIDALIKCGSKVNTLTWPRGPSTPLQAASAPGYERPDVAWLLLQHQANLGDIHPDSNIAALVAKGLLQEPAYVPLLPELDQQP